MFQPDFGRNKSRRDGKQERNNIGHYQKKQSGSQIKTNFDEIYGDKNIQQAVSKLVYDLVRINLLQFLPYPMYPEYVVEVVVHILF